MNDLSFDIDTEITANNRINYLQKGVIMNKGIGALIVGILALVGALALVALFVKKKTEKEQEFEDDYYDTDFDLTVDDEEFEHFFGDDEEEMFPEAEIPSDDSVEVEVLTDNTAEVNDFDAVEAEDLPSVDTSIGAIDDDDLVGVTDDDIEEKL